MPDILVPFDAETQALLNTVDRACAAQGGLMQIEARKASLGNKELEVDLETLVWLKIIKAYGILFNRGVDAGWITGVLTENK